jgi:hypothetical protein
MAAISNSFDMFFRAHDYASRVIGNINVSMAAQLGTFVQMGYKVPLVSRQVSAAMIVTAQATERYVRDLKELQKYSELNTKTAVKIHSTMEQTGGDLGDVIKLTTQLWQANHKLFASDNQIWLAKMKTLGIITEENGALDDQNKFIEEATKYLEKYKPGLERSMEAEYVFGDAVYANLVPLAAEKKALDELSNNAAYIAAVDRSKVGIEKNRIALISLNNAFKVLGVTIKNIVDGPLLVLVEMFTMTIKILTFLARPILWLLEKVSALITKFVEWAAVLGILGKIILWVAVFVLGLLIRNMLVVQALNLKNWLISLGGAWKELAGTIHAASRVLISIMFPMQDAMMSMKDFIEILKKCKGIFQALGSAIWGASKSLLVFLGWIALGVAILLGLWIVLNKLLKLLMWIGEKVSGLFAPISRSAREMSDSFKKAKESMDSWSAETVFGKIYDKIHAVNEEAKEGTKNAEHMFDTSKALYDSLGDSLERAINMPTSVVPALASRLKLNKELIDSLNKASIEMGKVATAGYQQGPKSILTAAAAAPSVVVDVSVDRDGLGEWYASQNSGR